jgi:replicative DNA helicase
VTTDRLPQDLDAERAVLGAMMWSRDAIGDVLAMLAEGDEFYQPAHQTIYGAIVDLHNQGVAPDPVSVGDRLRQLGQFDRVGGTRALHEMYTGVATATNAEHYAEIIQDCAARRRVLAAAQRLHQMAQSPLGGEDLRAMLEDARATVDTATASYRNRLHDEGADVADLAAASVERYAQPRPPGLPSGWPDLDDMLNGGLRPGNLCVVGAMTGVGKSVMGINWAMNVATSHEAPGVLFASLEMDRNEVMDRIFADFARVELDHLAGHNLDADEQNRVRARAQELRNVPLRIEDTWHLSLARLRSLARDCARRPEGLGLVVADYLQLMTPTDRKAPRYEQVSELSRGLKHLAKELNVPVVAMAQFNREGYKRSNPKPVLADLREAAIENDANVVILMWDDPDKPGERQVEVAKNRQGRTGPLALSWSPRYARLKSLSRMRAV